MRANLLTELRHWFILHVGVYPCFNARGTILHVAALFEISGAFAWLAHTDDAYFLVAKYFGDLGCVQ